MSGILEDTIQIIVNLIKWVLGIFDFVWFGKNIRLELIDILETAFFIGLLILTAKVLFSKSDSFLGKMIVILLFILVYLIAQIWIF